MLSIKLFGCQKVGLISFIEFVGLKKLQLLHVLHANIWIWDLVKKQKQLV